MNEMGIHGVVRGHKKPKTTVADSTAVRPPDLLDRDFTAPAPNLRWVADLTYVRLVSGGFVYVAFVVDVFSSTIVGWSLATHLRTELPLAAVALALNTRPRKTLGWRTPAEALDEYLRSAGQAGVATTP